VPYIDCNTGFPAIRKEDYDYTIIGSGAAGILLAIKLTEKGKRVLMIEAGHFDEDAERQSLNIILQTGKELESSESGRKRVLGGTTIAWGGQSLPFYPIDFSKRDWVQNSGWPLPIEEVQPYYNEANRFMGVDEADYEDDVFSMLGMKKQDFNRDELWYHFSKWAPEPNFKKLYHSTLERNVTVLYNTVATCINVDDNKLATTLELGNFKGQKVIIPVNSVIVATGSIEASRLLLASDKQVAGGLGNQSGWLGKCFMEHPCIEIGIVSTPNQYKLQQAFNTHLYKKRKYSVRISLAEKAQREQKVLNASMGIMFDYNDGRMDPYVEVRKYLHERKINSIPSLFTNMGAYLLSAKALVLNKLIYKHNARARAVVMMEQEPLKESAITLSNEVDAVGMRKASLNWQISHKTWDTVVYASGVLKRELKRLGFGELNVHAHINSANANWAGHLTDVNHHMGGTRMSATAEEGVVSTDLQVWGHPNIYVCSCSVFPTVSHSNPTLTMMALCIRLVNKLTAKN